MAQGSGPLANSGGTEGQTFPAVVALERSKSGVSKAFPAIVNMRFELISRFRKIEIGNGTKEGEYTHRSSSVRRRRKAGGHACRG